MADAKQMIEIAGRSLLEEKAKHGSMIVAAGSGVTLGTIAGYVIAAFSFMSIIFVMFRTSLEIKKANKEIELLDIKIEKEKAEEL